MASKEPSAQGLTSHVRGGNPLAVLTRVPGVGFKATFCSLRSHSTTLLKSLPQLPHQQAQNPRSQTGGICVGLPTTSIALLS